MLETANQQKLIAAPSMPARKRNKNGSLNFESGIPTQEKQPQISGKHTAEPTMAIPMDTAAQWRAASFWDHCSLLWERHGDSVDPNERVARNLAPVSSGAGRSWC